MSDLWNTGWDPYKSLVNSETNIQHLAQVIANHGELINELRGLASHQQEVIQQMVQQNNKLLQQEGFNRAELARLKSEILLLKSQGL